LVGRAGRVRAAVAVGGAFAVFAGATFVGLIFGPAAAFPLRDLPFVFATAAT
jgi:hypothetical protein